MGSKKAPAFKPVKSSNVDSYHYDPETKSLHVKFKTGKTYEYAGVEQSHVAELVNAPSFGSHVSKHIIPHFKMVRSY